MEKKGLYRATVLLLILVNAAALCMFGWRRVEAYRGAAELSEAARCYLSELGITMKSGLPDGEKTEREVITFLRDIRGETAVAGKITGSEKRISKGGQVYYYTGEKGECTFLGGGELVAFVTDCGINEKKESGVKHFVHKWLSDVGFDLSGAVVTAVADGDSWRVEITDKVAGLSVCNENLVVTVSGDGFLTISGCWRIGSPEETMSSGEVSQAAALTKYAAAHRGQLTFTEVEEIYSVYWLYKEQNGAVTLLPALRIVTDQGSFVIDAMTGEVLGE